MYKCNTKGCGYETLDRKQMRQHAKSIHNIRCNKQKGFAKALGRDHWHKSDVTKAYSKE